MLPLPPCLTSLRPLGLVLWLPEREPLVQPHYACYINSPLLRKLNPIEFRRRSNDTFTVIWYLLEEEGSDNFLKLQWSGVFAGDHFHLFVVMLECVHVVVTTMLCVLIK